MQVFNFWADAASAALRALIDGNKRSYAGAPQSYPRADQPEMIAQVADQKSASLNSITSLAMVSSVGGTASSTSLQTFCSRRNHIGGVTPSRPTRHARPCSVPSGCLIAAMKTLAPGLRSLLSPCT